MTTDRRHHRARLLLAAVAALAVGTAPLGCADDSGSPTKTAAKSGTHYTVPSAPPSGQKISDDRIERAVKTRLVYAWTIAAPRIDVEVTDGVVTLHGSVDNLRGKEYAVTLARTIKGVRAVVDRVAVAAAVRPATSIARDVKAALSVDPVASKRAIEVSCDGSVVTLEGTVTSHQEKTLITNIAKSVRGVRGIADRLTIVYPEQASDDQIAMTVKARLRNDALVDEGLIKTAVVDGVVTLSGIVGSAAEKAGAAFDAWTVGTKDVVNHLEVRWWARDALRRKRPAAKSDAAVASAVRDAFVFDPRVISFRPRIEVKSGVVTLRGSVDNLAAKAAAGHDAKNTVGVMRVVNKLTVKPIVRLDDVAIAARVNAAFLRDPTLFRYGPTATVKDGVVTLSGTVPTFGDKSLAATIAARVAGVSAVINNITVTPPLRDLADLEIRQRIEDNIAWSPWVDSAKVHVGVVRGVATLSGKVQSQAERRIATRLAHDGGAKTVVNNLVVEPRT